jgi:hypothetical protein
MIGLTWIPWNVAVMSGAVVGTAGIAVRGVQRRTPSRSLAVAGAFARELAIVLVLYALWRIVGTVSILKVNGAEHAGRSIWNFERALHLPSEHGLQHLFLKNSALIQFCNLYYASVHIPLMMIFLPLFWWRHRSVYPRVRNVIALTTLWCLAIQLIPVAPPRLVPSLHVLDTPALFGQSVYPSFGKDGPAQLSAMPSVHVAWAVIIGGAIVLASRSRWRWLALAHPVFTMIVVVVTGNHYWLDGIVAIVVLLAAVAFDDAMRRSVTRLRSASANRRYARGAVASARESSA